MAIWVEQSTVEVERWVSVVVSVSLSVSVVVAELKKSSLEE